MPVIIDRLDVAESVAAAPTHETQSRAATTDQPVAPIISALAIAASRAARLRAD